MSRYRFYTLDVFTETALGGNPLAVVLDAEDLSGERMQTIAAGRRIAGVRFGGRLLLLSEGWMDSRVTGIRIIRRNGSKPPANNPASLPLYCLDLEKAWPLGPGTNGRSK